MAAVELPRIVGGRYRPIRLLGVGGMGTVYEVEHLHTGQRLALKLLSSVLATSPTMVERFKREARAPAQIRSQHVVTVTDADVAPELGNAPYVVMELLEGEDFSARVGAEPEPPERVVGWLLQVARALDKAHRLGIVHRDLKPANLFLTTRDDGSPIVKILDFGIAKMVDAGNATTTGEMIGTPTYMSPEQARGDADITGAADRFALGLIAYRFLCGAIYWRTKSVAQLVHEIVYAPLDAPSTRESKLGPAFDEWFARATARDPAGRFASATEQVEALARALRVPLLPGDLQTPGATPRPSQSPASAGSIHSARTLTHSPAPSPALQSAALAPTEHAPSTHPGPRTARSVWIGASLAAAGIVATAAVGLTKTEPRPAPSITVASTAPAAVASPAAPSSSGFSAPPAPVASPATSVNAPAPSVSGHDADAPRPRAPVPLSPPRAAPAHRPAASGSADPFADQK